MAFWIIRADKYGQQEDLALENNIVIIDRNLPDLSQIQAKKDLEALYVEKYGSNKKKHVANVVGQIWNFLKTIKKGDLVALPLKSRSGIAIGQIVGDYEFKKIQSKMRHIRKAEWIDTLPRSSFDQDILFSFGAFLTVGRVRSENAEERVRRMLKGKTTQQIELEPELPNTDLEQYSKDQITKLIERKFMGHGLTRLVDEILKAKGIQQKFLRPVLMQALISLEA